jgi:hypothetical protein
MVLKRLGVIPAGQHDLFTQIQSLATVTESGWASTPDGLANALCADKGLFAGSFMVFPGTTADAACRKIAWATHQGVPPIALVRHRQHWVVVRGFDASADPTSADDTSYYITAIYTNDPAPPGTQDAHITLDTWVSDYLNGADQGFYQGKYVVVCDPSPAATSIGPSPPPPDVLTGTTLITPDCAAGRAMAAMTDFKLAARPDWKACLKDVTPGTPHLIQRTDMADTYYYIVPLVLPTTGAVSVMASIDARFGNYREAICFPASGPSAPGIDLDPQSVLARVAATPIRLPNLRGRLVVRKETAIVDPTLMWRPCRESFSPFYPFYLVHMGNQHVYMRVDGAVFRSLHSDAYGV